MSTVNLIDLSSIIFPIWHITASDPNPNATSIQTLERVRALAHGQPTVAVAIDSKTSLRREIDPTYKAQRKGEDRATLYHQMALVIDALKQDGFPVWSVDGYEADDVIASATARALQIPDTAVQIVSADKDLLALVSDRVTIKSLKDGSIIDAATVKAKFGVEPSQIHDYLCLVGDASDNIKGADKIGPVTAVKLLGAYGSLEGIYKAWHASPDTFTPAIQASLDTFAPRVDDVRNLVRLRADLAIPFEEIAVERLVPSFDAEGEDEVDPFRHDTPTGLPRQPAAPPTTTQAPESVQASPATPTAFTGPVAVPAPKRRTPRAPSPQAPIDAVVDPPAPAAQTAPVVEPAPAPEPVKPAAPPKAMDATKPTTALTVIDADYTRQLEPTSLTDAIQLAKYAFESRLFGAYGSPQGVLMTIMAGREMGMATMHSLRAFDVIDGKPTLKADAIRALILQSGKAEYFRCTARTSELATFIGKRKGEDPPITLTYTMDEARQAGLLKPGSGWTKNPADMLVARASAKLARLIWPDVIHGIYAKEELE